MKVVITAVPLLLCLVSLTGSSSIEHGLVVITVATEANDGFNRFMRSAKLYDLDVKVLGMGEEWRGGDVARYAGGGQKVKLLKTAMEKYKDRDDVLVMFVDSYDVVFTAGTEAILSSFKKFNAKVVFSAEDFCWPDPGLSEKYPEVTMNEKRYLNSGGFIGYAPNIYKIVTSSAIQDHDDDQLFYTNIYLDKNLRDDLSIKLDNRGEIFQNLNGALDEVKLKFKGSNSFLYNMKTGTRPIVIHGNGPIKPQFNTLANYLSDQWTPSEGCQACKENTFTLKGYQVDDFPKVLIGLFMEHPTAFASDFLDRIVALNYPKSRIDLFIHYADKYHNREFKHFLAEQASEYNSVKVIRPEQELTSGQARNKALEWCLYKGCDYYMNIDGDVQIEKENLLQILIEKNRTVIVPMVTRHKMSWSNFWGALSTTGFYKRSEDYMDILKRNKIGQWNVPYMTDIYLIHSTKIPLLKGGYIDGKLDPDMAICKRMREKGIFMMLDNQDYFGHLVNSENFETTHLHNDLYMIMDNQHAWEKKYIHPLYKEKLNPYTEVEEPCPDVYWFPIVTTTYCKQLIEEMENHGEWSGGRNEDKRLAGGYENVPTVDIHMNQIGMEKHWLFFLKNYISPLATKVFWGYYSDSRAIMNFVVKYKPGEQDHLRPHHDSSTFTINIALNTPDVDFTGGGCRFTRYNCSVTKTRPGWMFLHPGRLTHQHEGLKVTGGTRYIMVCFVDP